MSARQSNSVIRAVKQSIYERCATNPYFANIPGLVVIPKDIFSGIEKGILPIGSGIAFFVEAFSAGKSDTGTAGPFFEGGKITFTVVEQPTLNTANPDCDEVAETAMRLIQQYAPELGLLSACISDPSEVENEKFSIRRFYINLPIGFDPIVLPAMPTVVVTPNVASGAYPLNVVLSLAAPVPGAAIFYTLDGSFPMPLNPAAKIWEPLQPMELTGGNNLQLADGQFLMVGGTIVIPSAGTRIKARAYLAGYQSGQPTDVLFS